MKIKNLMVTLLLTVTTLAVIVDYIYLQHKTRNKFVALQALIEKQHHLSADWGRLQIEHSTLVNNSRIEKETKKRLNMKLPENEHILNLKR